MPLKFTDRSIAYLKAAAELGGSPSIPLSQSDSPVVRSYSTGICICYVVDEGKSFQYVQQRHLTQDGIRSDELHRIGLRNLAIVASKRDLRVQPYQNIFAVLMGGDFEASLILLDQLWDRQFRRFVKADYAIAIPARDVLSFCDSSSEQGKRELRDLINRVTPKGDHLLSDKVYSRRNGEFVLI